MAAGGIAVAKEKKTDQPKKAPSGDSSEAGPDSSAAGDKSATEYTKPILLRLPFKERVEEVAARVNRKRQRLGLAKRPLGWFVERGMRDWLELVEAAEWLSEEGEPL